MRTLEQLQSRLVGFDKAQYIYDPLAGYIAWHFSTGDNLEGLFLEAKEKRKGHGKELYRRMCQYLLFSGTRPYHSVFAYRLSSNEEANAFYAALGFTQVDLGQSIYRGDGTTIMWITWEDLLKGLEITT